MYTVSKCYNPEWDVRQNQNSVGASQYKDAQSVQECLDYCGSKDSCVGVDVDMNKYPPTCWPHLSAEDLLDKNVYSQPGTNQYRLTNRCATGAITGFTCLIVMKFQVVSIFIKYTFISL